MPAGAGLLDSLGPHRMPRRVDGPLTRVRAALLWTSLDRALARGVDPSASRALACRAAQLTSIRSRRRLEAGLGRFLSVSRRSGRSPGPAVIPDRREVDLAQPLLMRLEALLLSEAPVYARGTAGLELLPTDGVGCAYAPAYPGQLLDELEGLGLALEGREEGW